MTNHFRDKNDLMSDPAVSPLTTDPDIPAAGKMFYGWWMVVAGMAVLIVSSGIGFYGHGVILDPLTRLHGWSKGLVSSAVTLYFLTGGVAGLFTGRIIDRYGPKPVLVIGSIVISLGFLMLSRVQSLWQLYAVYFIMAVGWTGTSLVPINTLIANWFIQRRGLALGYTMTGLSLGGVFLVPLASKATTDWGLAVSLPLMGALFWIVVIPLALFVIKARPADVGQHPDGKPPGSAHTASNRPGLSYEAQMRVWSAPEAMRTTAFWAIVVSFLLALGGQMTFLVHQVSFLSQYLGVSGAASAVSITAGASIIGRLSLGVFVDRLDKRRVAIACFIMQGVAVLAMAYSSHVAVLYLGTMIFGLTMGNLIMMQSLLVGECFGMVSFGTVSGAGGLFTMAGAAMGPMIAGVIFDATQSYRVAFTIFAVASVLAAVTVRYARPPQTSPSPATSVVGPGPI